MNHKIVRKDGQECTVWTTLETCISLFSTWLNDGFFYYIIDESNAVTHVFNPWTGKLEQREEVA